MINRNELRIGNWVYGGCYLFVLEIAASGITYDCKHKVADHREWESIEPILLYPELLEKCGFKKNPSHPGLFFYNGLRYDTFRMLLSILRPCDKAGESQPHQCGYSSGDKINVSYLHQLQNLYFALTGTELNIDL